MTPSFRESKMELSVWATVGTCIEPIVGKFAHRTLSWQVVILGASFGLFFLLFLGRHFVVGREVTRGYSLWICWPITDLSVTPFNDRKAIILQDRVISLLNGGVHPSPFRAADAPEKVECHLI